MQDEITGLLGPCYTYMCANTHTLFKNYIHTQPGKMLRHWVAHGNWHLQENHRPRSGPHAQSRPHARWVEWRAEPCTILDPFQFSLILLIIRCPWSLRSLWSCMRRVCPPLHSTRKAGFGIQKCREASPCRDTIGIGGRHRSIYNPVLSPVKDGCRKWKFRDEQRVCVCVRVG